MKIYWFKRPKFWEKIEVFFKNRNFGQKSKTFSKIEFLAKNQKFSQKSKFFSKIESFLTKSKVFSKIKIMVKNRNVQKIEFQKKFNLNKIFRHLAFLRCLRLKYKLDFSLPFLTPIENLSDKIKTKKTFFRLSSFLYQKYLSVVRRCGHIYFIGFIGTNFTIFNFLKFLERAV